MRSALAVTVTEVVARTWQSSSSSETTDDVSNMETVYRDDPSSVVSPLFQISRSGLVSQKESKYRRFLHEYDRAFFPDPASKIRRSIYVRSALFLIFPSTLLTHNVPLVPARHEQVSHRAIHSVRRSGLLFSSLIILIDHPEAALFLLDASSKAPLPARCPKTPGLFRICTHRACQKFTIRSFRTRRA